MRDAVIVEAVRTAVGKRAGALSRIEPMRLAAHILDTLIQRSGVYPELVDDVIMGCVTQLGEQGANIGRLAALDAGLPVSVPAVSINRMCGSSQQAVHFACQAILAGDAEIVIAAGVESMSRVAMGSDFPETFPVGFPYELVSQGISAELMATKWGLGREALDAYALESHRKAAQAQAAGHFTREIVPVPLDSHNGHEVLFCHDEGIRAVPDPVKMAALKPAFRDDGVITAGNASQISDGAAALLLMSLTKARELGLRPRAKVISRAVVGSDPILMLSGPIPATRKALSQAGLEVKDMDLFEINEAFASVPLAWIQEMGVPRDRVNPNGGAIALGHPLGCTGAKLMVTLLHELERTGLRYGLQSMCIGHGQATATILERLDN